MNRDNALCSNCNSGTPQVFCTCTDPITYLCNLCMTKHVVNNPHALHSTKAMDQLPHYNIPGYYERMQVRDATLPQVKEHVQQSVQEVDKAIDDYSSEVEKLICELVRDSKKVIKSLKEVRSMLSSETEAALEEVERTLKDDSPTLTTQYGPVLRDMVQNPRTFQLFSFTMKASPLALETMLSLKMKLLSPKDLNQHERFAGVFNDHVFLYDLETEETTKHPLSVNFGEGGSWIETPYCV